MWNAHFFFFFCVTVFQNKINKELEKYIVNFILI